VFFVCQPSKHFSLRCKLALQVAMFVATSAPGGWKPGRWTEISKTAWQEEKIDNPKIVYQFQVVSGPSMPGSSTVRLKMKDQNTEVLLLAQSAQIFVNGSYFGEYGGEWQRKGSKGAAPAPAPAAARSGGSKGQAPAAAGREAPAQPSKGRVAPPELEQTLAPAEQARAPSRQQQPPPQQSAPRERAVTPAPAFDRTPAPALSPSRPRKPDGLDKSEKSIQSLIEASKSGNVAKVNELLASGIDPDGPAKGGGTPLMAATTGGHLAVVEALLAAFADPTMGQGQETPLTIAFQKGKQEILKVLMGASFSNLNTMVCSGGGGDITYSAAVIDNEVPDNASSELRGITAQLMKQGTNRPESPSGKYGNYTHLATHGETDEKDSDTLREEAIRYQMRGLVKTVKSTPGMAS